MIECCSKTCIEWIQRASRPNSKTYILLIVLVVSVPWSSDVEGDVEGDKEKRKKKRMVKEKREIDCQEPRYI